MPAFFRAPAYPAGRMHGVLPRHVAAAALRLPQRGDRARRGHLVQGGLVGMGQAPAVVLAAVALSDCSSNKTQRWLNWGS